MLLTPGTKLCVETNQRALDWEQPCAIKTTGEWEFIHSFKTFPLQPSPNKRSYRLASCCLCWGAHPTGENFQLQSSQSVLYRRRDCLNVISASSCAYLFASASQPECIRGRLFWSRASCHTHSRASSRASRKVCALFCWVFSVSRNIALIL